MTPVCTRMVRNRKPVWAPPALKRIEEESTPAPSQKREGMGHPAEQKERGARQPHKRLLYYVNVNRTSLDHLLLGRSADIDKCVEGSDYSANGVNAVGQTGSFRYSEVSNHYELKDPGKTSIRKRWNCSN